MHREMHLRHKWITLAAFCIMPLLFAGCARDCYGTDEKTDQQIEAEAEYYIMQQYGDNVTVLSHSVAPAEVAVDNFFNMPVWETVSGCDRHTMLVCPEDMPDCEIEIVYIESYRVGSKLYEACFSENYTEDKAENQMLSTFRHLAQYCFPSAIVCEDKQAGDYDVFVACNDFDRFSKLARLLKSYVDSMRDEHYASYSIYVFASEAELQAADIEGYIGSDRIVEGLAYGKDVISALYQGKTVEKIYGKGNSIPQALFEMSADAARYQDDPCTRSPDAYQSVVRWYSCEPNVQSNVPFGEVAGNMQIFGVR